ncbi:MAG: SDR family oxidoreductase [Saprospiraceae bacterium]|nr:SDR family oxidoreductase [Saprospiraceae bacterium]
MNNAVVTGGTKGIGKALCKLFAESGFNVATCSRNSSDLALLKQELSQHPVEVLVHQADLSNKLEIKSMAAFVSSRWERIDILVNNAGIFVPGSVLTEDEDSLDTMLANNLYSAYFLSRHLVPMMVEQRSGHVFNICSVASITAYPNGGSYTISKHAMLGFSRMLRLELKDKGIKVTSVIPGATWTFSWEGANFPEDRLMQPDDIARSILSAYLLGPTAVVEEILIRPQLGDL